MDTLKTNCDFVLRLANMDDSQELFNCRNDMVTRQNSRNQNRIDLEHHKIWLTKVIENPNRELFILEYGGKKIGTSRLDYEANGTCEISWSIFPESRGKKYGTQLIKMTLNKAKCTVRAEIKETNISSIKIAIKSGMQFLYTENHFSYYIYVKNITDINTLISLLKASHKKLQFRKKENFHRQVSFGDLISERNENARAYGFGEGTTCYDNVLILGDVKIGKNVWIGPNVILDGSGGLEIGDFVSISSGVHIYTHDTVAWSTSLGNKAITKAPVKIGSGVYLGPNSIVSKGVTIGDKAIIGAMSFVNKDIPENSRAWGSPAKIQ